MTVMKKSNKEDAVSPVIGVMLMLVVTIIIAAVVAAFATGLGNDVESIPNAALKATVDSSTGVLYLSSISGDRIDLNKVTVTVYDDDDSKLATYFNPSELPGVGRYLESGETIDVKKASGSSTSLSVSRGDVVEVIVQYDASSILYDREVVVE